MIRHLTIDAMICNSDVEAIQEAADCGYAAVRLQGKPMAVAQGELDRLESFGVSFAYLTSHTDRQGVERLITVPVN
jgi:hypothetical protein